ncbi:hypothetical protein BU17DRAFT_45101 [Hysterangium stoloniferum]|nr:hypothetical protein BU17DRAFT_45101 [Hysterangium stoloniferum]
MKTFSTVKRTYADRSRQYLSSPRSSSPCTSPTAESTGKRKRTLLDSSAANAPPPKRASISGSDGNPKLRSTLNNLALSSRNPKSTKSSKKAAIPAKPLTQLHFIVKSTVRTCPLCSLSYIKGAVDDEALHKKHCGRIQRGLDWGKEEEKEAQRAGVRVIQALVTVKGSTGTSHGRIIAVPADATGKIGAKISSVLETINLILSAPTLPPETLKGSKAYLLLIPAITSSRERIAGCVIAQHITHAMNVMSDPGNDKENQKDVIQVDGGLYCSPQLYSTPMGIPRLFVPSTHRRKGIALMLLNAAAKTFVHGCELDPTKGQIAFSQPTGDGRKVMERWGKGGVRIYQE